MAPLSDDDEMALRAAEASLKAGHVVDHADVRQWLLSWGRAQELPAPTVRP